MANLNDRVTELEHQVAALTALVESLTMRPQFVERKQTDFFEPFRITCSEASQEVIRELNPSQIMCDRQVEADPRRKPPDEWRRDGLM